MTAVALAHRPVQGARRAHADKYRFQRLFHLVQVVGEGRRGGRIATEALRRRIELEDRLEGSGGRHPGSDGAHRRTDRPGERLIVATGDEWDCLGGAATPGPVADLNIERLAGSDVERSVVTD